MPRTYCSYYCRILRYFLPQNPVFKWSRTFPENAFTYEVETSGTALITILSLNYSIAPHTQADVGHLVRETGASLKATSNSCSRDNVMSGVEWGATEGVVSGSAAGAVTPCLVPLWGSLRRLPGRHYLHCLLLTHPSGLSCPLVKKYYL